MDSLVNGNNVDEIGSVLSNYNFDTRFKEKNKDIYVDIDLINAFSLFCRKHGYGELQSSISAEESVFQNHCKQLVKDFVNNMKNNEYDKAYKIIETLNTLTIANIWNEIIDKQKINILYYNQGDPKNIVLSEPEKELCKHINAYYTFKNNLLSEKTRALEKMLDLEMCSQGLISLYSMSAEQFMDELSRTSDPDKRSILDQVIKTLRKMADLDQKIEAMLIKYTPILTSKGITLPDSGDAPKKLFHILFNTIINKDANPEVDKVYHDIINEAGDILKQEEAGA